MFVVWIANACNAYLLHCTCLVKEATYVKHSCWVRVHTYCHPASMLENHARRQLSECNCHDHHGSPLQDGDPNLLQHYADASHTREYTKRYVSSSVYACTIWHQKATTTKQFCNTDVEGCSGSAHIQGKIKSNFVTAVAALHLNRVCTAHKRLHTYSSDFVFLSTNRMRPPASFITYDH